MLAIAMTGCSSTEDVGVAELSETRVDFGQVDCGASAPPSASITISSTGGPIVYGVTLVSPDGFALEGATGGTLDVGASATITVTAPSVQPTAAAGQTLQGVLLVTTGVFQAPAFSVPVVMQIGGPACETGFIVAPTNLDFGLTDCGSFTSPLTFDVANDSGTAVAWSATLTGGVDSAYRLSALGGVLVPGASDTVTVTPKAIPAVASTGANGFGDTITITTDLPNDSPRTIALQQTARGAILVIATTTLNFAATQAGATTLTTQDLAVTNSGNIAATVTLAHVGNSLTAQSFQLPATPTSIAPGNGAVPITFDPLAEGTSTTGLLLAASGNVLCGPLPTTAVAVGGVSTSIAAPVLVVVGGGNQNRPLNASQCALLNTDRVACWGGNDNGQLGIGSSGGTRLVPHIVRNLTDVANVASNGAANFALTNSGTVLAWGRGDRFQLGNDSTASTDVPVDIGLTNIAQVDADHQQACALTNTSDVLCWGSRRRGNGGVSNSVPTLTLPAPTGATYTSIAVGSATVCALRNDGLIDCQGANGRGQLGNNTTSNFSAAVTRVSNISTATAIEGGGGSGRGGSFFCALLANGTVQCWGNLSRGKNGGTISSGVNALVPVTIPNLSNIAQISVGSQHACARTNASTVLCWGQNQQAQVGVNASSGSAAVVVAGLANPTKVIVGGRRSCAFADGGLFCWGEGIGPTPQLQAF